MGFKYNPLTGQLDLVGAGSTPVVTGGFPPTIIEDGETVTVGPRQQMLTKIPVVIEPGGTLAVLADSAHVALV